MEPITGGKDTRQIRKGRLIVTEETAKRAHKCNACGKAIEKGDARTSFFIIFPGRAEVFLCLDCSDAVANEIKKFGIETEVNA